MALGCLRVHSTSSPIVKHLPCGKISNGSFSQQIYTPTRIYEISKFPSRIPMADSGDNASGCIGDFHVGAGHKMLDIVFDQSRAADRLLSLEELALS